MSKPQRYTMRDHWNWYVEQKLKLKNEDSDEEKRREIARLAAVVYGSNEYSQTRIEDAVHVARKIIEETESIPSEKLCRSETKCAQLESQHEQMLKAAEAHSEWWHHYYAAIANAKGEQP